MCTKVLHHILRTSEHVQRADTHYMFEKSILTVLETNYWTTESHPVFLPGTCSKYPLGGAFYMKVYNTHTRRLWLCPSDIFKKMPDKCFLIIFFFFLCKTIIICDNNQQPYLVKECVSLQTVRFEGIIHSKIKTPSSFAHPHVSLNLHADIIFWNTKVELLKNLHATLFITRTWMDHAILSWTEPIHSWVTQLTRGQD